MKISDVMTREVATIPPDASLVEAGRVMRAQNIGFLPVVRRKQILGVLTDRDIVIRSICEGRDPRSTRVRDVMTHVWIWCYEDEVLTEAARILAENHIRRLLVLGHNKTLVGLLSLDDLAAKMSSDRLLGTVLRQVTAAA
jgi:CBS domain-containing protein